MSVCCGIILIYAEEKNKRRSHNVPTAFIQCSSVITMTLQHAKCSHGQKSVVYSATVVKMLMSTNMCLKCCVN